jgi:hypothetical protein
LHDESEKFYMLEVCTCFSENISFTTTVRWLCLPRIMAERPEIGKTKQGKGENDVSRQKIMMRLRSKHKSKANATTSYSKKRSAEKMSNIYLWTKI